MAQNGASAPLNQPIQQIQSQAPSQTQQAQQITTEKIQQYLDENDTFIQAIFENMNANRLKDCIQYQTRLQTNLMYLAAIADQNPQPQ